MVFVLLAGTFGVWRLVIQAEREMSEELLGRTRLAAKAVNPEKVRTLTGTRDDIESTNYQQLREQLISIHEADPNCKDVYLMGRRDDGTVFFFMDSEPKNSRDFLSPGEVFDEVAEEDLRVFETGTAAVFGPVTDRWGTWISSLVPMTDSQTGKIIAVLGMDIDARDWHWNVAARAGWPVGVTLLLMVGLLSALLALTLKKTPSSPKPVMRRLLPFLTFMLLALVLTSALIMWKEHYDRVAGRTALISSDVEWRLKNALEQQASAMTMTALSITVDSRVKEALKTRNADLIPIGYQDMFKTQHREQSLTHFLFYDVNRICLKRFHKPDLIGGKIERLATLESERTGKPAWGIDIGLAGKAALRSVLPVLEDDNILGYIELGTEIDSILEELQTPFGVEIALSLKKEAIRQVDLKEGMSQADLVADWERLPDSVIVYESKGHLPDVFAQLINHDSLGSHHDNRSWNIINSGRNWNVTISPLADSSGEEVGDILIMIDITRLKASFRRDITLGGIVVTVILAALLSLSHVVLRHTDACIRVQEAKLRESREHISATLRSIGDGVIACDTDGTVVSLNAAAEALTGWSNAEAAGVSIREVFRIIDSRSREPAEIPVFHAIAEGVNVDMTNHTALIAKDGTEHQIADSCAPIKDASGTVSGAVLVFRDVTREYRQREELRESEERFQQLAAQSRTATWEINSEGLYTFISPIAKEILGYDPEEIVGKVRFYDLHPDGEREEIKEMAFGIFSRKERFLDLVRPAKSKSGEIRWISTNGIPLLNPDGTLRGYRGSYTDVTERKQMNEALSKANERFALAVKGSNDGIWDWDIKTDELYLSPRWKEILGYEDHELENRYSTFTDLVYEEDLGKLNDHLQRYFKGELNEYALQLRMKHKDGSQRWILTRGAAIRDENNRPYRMTGSHTDITLQKMSEEALKVAKTEAEAATRAKSVFLANMSHEIRTPLNGVIGFTDLLRNTNLTQDQRSYVENANISAHSLLSIISDILDFSKIEAGRMTLEYIMTDMFQLFEQSVDIVKFNAVKKKLEILLNLDVNMPRFGMVDPVRLNQVLVNLLGNAVKFTAQGEVELKVRHKPLEKNRGVFSISVRDTGIGISKEQQKKLFKAFSQADTSTTRKYGGTGLGLTISDMLVEQMGSKIQVESVEGQGSTFFFDLCVDTANGEAHTPEAISHIERALIIDDNANNRLILEHMLENWDIESESCADGLSALDILNKSKPFDIIICDYNMPQIDGLETIRRIQEKMELTPEKLPMILLYSSSDDPDIHEKSHDLGVRFCINKPVKREQLLACFASAHEPKKRESSTGSPEAGLKPTDDTMRENPTAGPVILVAEDVRLNMELVKVLLSKLFRGVVIHEAETGLAAVQKYREFHPNLILMDLQMPEMDGREATQKIRELERDSGKRVPIIALSAEAQPEEMESSLQAGIDDYITKPIDAKKLKSVLKKHLKIDTTA